jgi:hypothetical protein
VAARQLLQAHHRLRVATQQQSAASSQPAQPHAVTRVRRKLRREEAEAAAAAPAAQPNDFSARLWSALARAPPRAALGRHLLSASVLQRLHVRPLACKPVVAR